jgi:hypothetical protein
MFGEEYKCYATPKDFLEGFGQLTTVVGGLFTSTSSSVAELIISRSSTTGQLYIWENFCIPRRMKVFLPVHVYVISAEILSDVNFRHIKVLQRA